MSTYSNITINGLQLLPSNGYTVTEATGLFGKATRSSVQARTGQDGAFVFNQNWEERTISFVVSVVGENETDYFNKVEDLLQATRKNGNTLKIQLWNGVERQIEAYIVNQPETNLTGGRFNLDTFQFSFICPDPYYSSTTEKTSTLTDFESGGGVIPSVTGVVLTPSGNSFSIENEGDIPVFPKLEITGKFDSFVLTNTTTGEFVKIIKGLSDNKKLTAEVTQNGEFVTLDGSNYKQFFPRDLFEIDKGVNNLVVTSTGSNSNSEVKLTIREKFEIIK